MPASSTSWTQPGRGRAAVWPGVLSESKTLLMLNARECRWDQRYPVSLKLYVTSCPLDDVNAIQVAMMFG